MSPNSSPDVSISLTKIRGFLAVAKYLSFRRAADELGITQPALSGQIKALEDSLKAKLFTRTTRQVDLTADGARCLLRARRLLKEFEAGILEMRDPAELPQGTVSFSCVPSLVAHLFPKLIRELKRRYPGVTAEMTDDSTVVMERRLLSREVDFGIGGPPQVSEELEFAPVVYDRFVIICRTDHPLAKKPRVSLKRVLKYPIISLAKGSNVRNTLSAHFTRIGHTFDPAYEMVHHYSLGAMVEAGLGIALLPSMACDEVKSLSHLRIVELDDGTFTRPVGLLKRRGATLSAAAYELYMLSERTIRSAHIADKQKRMRRPTVIRSS